MSGLSLNPSLSLKATLVAGTALMMSGCALLSSPDPVTLYRFGAAATASETATATAGVVPVALRRIEFPEASTGDKILGITGTEAAYIKGARWVSPAETLFNDSLENAFNARPDQVRLIGRRELGAATRVLGLDVTAFEARYDAPGTAPTVIITARARMTVLPQRSVVNERVFTVSQPATENRIGAIVDAFDIATRDINTQIVDWTASASR